MAGQDTGDTVSLLSRPLSPCLSESENNDINYNHHHYCSIAGNQKLDFGKFNGHYIRDVKPEYLFWLLERRRQYWYLWKSDNVKRGIRRYLSKLFQDGGDHGDLQIPFGRKHRDKFLKDTRNVDWIDWCVAQDWMKWYPFYRAVMNRYRKKHYRHEEVKRDVGQRTSSPSFFAEDSDNSYDGSDDYDPDTDPEDWDQDLAGFVVPDNEVEQVSESSDEESAKSTEEESIASDSKSNNDQPDGNATGSPSTPRPKRAVRPRVVSSSESEDEGHGYTPSRRSRRIALQRVESPSPESEKDGRKNSDDIISYATSDEPSNSSPQVSDSTSRRAASPMRGVIPTTVTQSDADSDVLDDDAPLAETPPRRSGRLKETHHQDLHADPGISDADIPSPSRRARKPKSKTVMSESDSSDDNKPLGRSPSKRRYC